jgi:Rrf2 family transcriptional regulator, cysteine metabolism repressor
MWISRRTDYATRAVLALALAEGRALKAEELARRVVVPESFMKQILMRLRDAGVLRSERGPSGGYRLNHDPADLTMDRVVRVFQGQLAPIDCTTRSAPEPCPMQVSCSLQSVWAEVRDVTIDILERTTFADLAERAGGRWTDPTLPPATVASYPGGDRPGL